MLFRSDLRGEFDKAHPVEVNAVQEYRATRGRDAFDRIRTETVEGLAALAPVAEQDKALYREQAGDFVRDQAVATQRELQRLKDEGVNLGDREGDLGLLYRYFAATEPATDKTTHVTDFDKRDLLEDEFRDGLKPEEGARLDAMLAYSADPVYQQLKLAKRELDRSGYFDRRDEAFVTFKRRIPETSPMRAVADKQWGTLDEFEDWVKADTVRRGVPEQLYDRHPAWNAWEDIGGELTNADLVRNPEVDVLATIWGYQSRVHSAEAARLYERQTGKPAPIPAR